MGLDLVEYRMAVEDAFEIDIPDEVAATLTTPRKAADYIFQHIDHADSGPYLLQRAFYRVRRAIAAHVQVERRSLRPDTVVSSVLAVDHPDDLWARIRVNLDVSDTLPLRAPSWWRTLIGSPPTTLGSLAAELVAHYPTTLKRPGEGWTHAQVCEVLTTLLEDYLAVDMSKHTLDSRFRQDMGLD